MKFALAPPFRPARWFRSGHAQTIAGSWLRSRVAPAEGETTRHSISLPDGDGIVLHENHGRDWQPTGRVALLIHGLAGSAHSGYMLRTAHKLNQRCVRTFRLDMRGCGHAYGQGRLPAHSARVGDLLAAIERIAALCPGSRLTIVGFSLGANLVLNTLAEIGDGGRLPIDRAITVSPPIDLAECSAALKSGRFRPYDRHFLSAVLKMVADRPRLFPDLPPIEFPARPRTLWEFDHLVTAPLAGFAGAEEYYRGTAPCLRLAQIAIPTLIVAAADDPLVPVSMYQRYARANCVELQIIAGGGHLGFLGRRSSDADRRWLDWRLVEWVLGT